PNGAADVNQFQAAGGPGWVMGQLLDAGLLHADVATVAGEGLADYAREPWLDGDTLAWRSLARHSVAPDVLRSCTEPFAPEGGLAVLEGNLGRAMIKTSAVDPAYWRIRAPARVFDSETAVQHAYTAGELVG